MHRVEVRHQGARDVVERVERLLSGALERLEGRIHRTTVWLRDANGPRGGAEDKECTVKVDIRGAPLVAVHARGATYEEATAQASERVRTAVLRVLQARRSVRRKARRSPPLAMQRGARRGPPAGGDPLGALG